MTTHRHTFSNYNELVDKLYAFAKSCPGVLYASFILTRGESSVRVQDADSGELHVFVTDSTPKAIECIRMLVRNGFGSDDRGTGRIYLDQIVSTVDSAKQREQEQQRQQKAETIRRVEKWAIPIVVAIVSAFATAAIHYWLTVANIDDINSRLERVESKNVNQPTTEVGE